MKVVIFLAHYGLGGSNLYVIPYIKYLSSKGVKPIVISKKAGGVDTLLRKYGASFEIVPIPLGLNVTNIPYIRSNYFGIQKIVKDILKLMIGLFVCLKVLYEKKADLVIANEFSLLPVILAARLLKIPILTFVQTGVTDNVFLRRIVFKTISKSQYIVGISNGHIEKIKENIAQRATRPTIHVIPNTIVQRDHNPQLFNEYFTRLDVTTPNIIFGMGGLSNIKGAKQFIAIAQDIITRRDDVTFILAGGFHKDFSTKYASGTSEDESDLSEEILLHLEQNKLSDKIKVIGETPFIEPLLLKSNAVLCPTTYPHFLRPILEAWSFKKPVIVSNDYITAEIVSNNIDGLLIECNAIPQFVHAIENVLDHPEYSEMMGENGYRKYQNQYHETIINQKISQLFSSLLTTN